MFRPKARRGHCCVVVGDKLLIYGGLCGGGVIEEEGGQVTSLFSNLTLQPDLAQGQSKAWGQYTTSVHVLDTNRWCWSEPAVHGHASCVFRPLGHVASACTVIDGAITWFGDHLVQEQLSMIGERFFGDTITALQLGDSSDEEAPWADLDSVSESCDDADSESDFDSSEGDY